MKIGIVSDLPDVVDILSGVICSVSEHEILWVARTGANAISSCVSNAPDLILFDIAMPDMEGIEVVRHLTKETSCPILIVSAHLEADTSRIFSAMGHGALDVVSMPSPEVTDVHARAAPLLAKINMIRKLIGHSPDRRGGIARSASPHSSHLLVIGASAGGPAALGEVLCGLPEDFPAAVVIVQHVDERFTSGMAEWLNQHSTLPVRLAVEGDRPARGTVLLAGTGDHLVFKSPDRLGYTPDPVDYVYRPSVNVFFWSVCKHWRGSAVGVLLTGMGSDGALGLKSLKDIGHHTIAQDKTSSAVYGMPKAAAKLGAATDILPLADIAPKLVKTFSSRKNG
tara:strand:- start:9661 stop:10677 length:1017 start_codon:yes stop_codon:yes gene_type:complete